jgi:integrase/recombinase XerC
MNAKVVAFKMPVNRNGIQGVRLLMRQHTQVGTDADNKVTAQHLRYLRNQGRSPVTIYHRHCTLIRLAGYLGGTPLLEATPDDLYAWRDSLGHLGPGTIYAYVSHVRAFYDWAVKQKLITANPVIDVPVPKLPRRHPRPITETELMHALEHAPSRIRVWLVLAAWCGLRAKEVALLQADSIRLYDDKPHLKITFDATKGSTERTIPLHPYVISALQRAELPSAGYVFRKLDGEPVGPNLVSKLSNQHLHALGITDTFHSLRHRFLSQAYGVEYNLRAVQELAGHSRIDTTAGYAAIDSTALARTVDAIPAPEQEAS